MEDPFTRELRAARARIAELQRRHGATAGAARRQLLPAALAEVDTALEELAVTGQELQAQTAELAATREALEAERARYQELFQSAPVAYLVTDPLGRIREANRAAAALLETRPGFLPGKPLAAFVAYDDRFTFRVMLNRLRLGETSQVEDAPLRLRRRGGDPAATQVTVTAVRDRAGTVRALRWLVRDTAAPGGPEPLLVVSVDQAIGQEAARRRQLEALAALDPVEDLDGTVQLVLDAGTRLVRVDATACMLLDKEGRPAAVGASDEPALAFARAQEHLEEGPGVDALRHQRTVWSGDLAADRRWGRLRPAAAVNRVGAVMAAPVRLYGGPIGACLLLSVAPRPWTDDQIEAAEAYAAVLAGLLELAAEAQRSAALARRVQRLLARLDRPDGEPAS